MLGNNSIYSPDELVFLRRVFDEAIESLPIARRTATVRSAVAKQLLECAKTGERSRVELRIAALGDLNEAENTQFRDS